MIKIEDVHQAIVSQECVKLGKKTTVCITTLTNGFEIITTAACVNAEEYNHEIGSDVAKSNALNKVWELLGFLAQAEKVSQCQENLGQPEACDKAECAPSECSETSNTQQAV